MNLFTAFLTAADGATPAGGTGSMLSMVLMIVGFIAIYYFLIHRPQKKQDAERKQLLDNLQVGDEITTTGGIIGKIISMKEETLMMETGNDKTKIRILKTSVRRVDVKAEDAE